MTKRIFLLFVITVLVSAAAYSYEVVVGGAMKSQDDLVYGAYIGSWWDIFHFGADVGVGQKSISIGAAADFYTELSDDFFTIGLAPGLIFNLELSTSGLAGIVPKFDIGIHLPVIFNLGLRVGSRSNNIGIGNFMLQVSPALSILFDKNNVSEPTTFAGFRGSSIVLGLTIGRN